MSTIKEMRTQRRADAVEALRQAERHDRDGDLVTAARKRTQAAGLLRSAGDESAAVAAEKGGADE